MTLFDSLEPEKRKVSGNPYHAFNGRFSAKPTPLQIAQRKIAALENNQAYLISIAVNAGEMLRIKDEKIMKLEKQINQAVRSGTNKMKKINLLVEGGWKAFEFESEEFKNQLAPAIAIIEQ